MVAEPHPHRPTVSFELMPPRRPNAAPNFWETAQRLVAARPDFVSVTYGAAGGDRATAREVLATLLRGTPELPVAHLTCVGASREDVSEVIEEFLEAGVRSFLALRGDPPRDEPDWRPPADGVRSSVDLVRLLRQVDERRCAADVSTALRSAARPLAIAVATFPDGNPGAGTTREQEVRRLLEKQEAGASFAITQFFYRADSYTGFVESSPGSCPPPSPAVCAASRSSPGWRHPPSSCGTSTGSPRPTAPSTPRPSTRTASSSPRRSRARCSTPARPACTCTRSTSTAPPSTCWSGWACRGVRRPDDLHSPGLALPGVECQN